MSKYREAVGLPSEGPRLTVPPLAPLPGPIGVVPPASSEKAPSPAAAQRPSAPVPVAKLKGAAPVVAAPAAPAEPAPVVIPLPAPATTDAISGRAFAVQSFADAPQPAAAASAAATAPGPRSGRHRTGIGLDLHGSSSDTAHGRRADLDEGTLAFERSLAEAAAKRQRRWRFAERIVFAIVLAIAIAEGIVIKFSLLSATTMPGSTGAFQLDSRPSGVSVLIDGEARRCDAPQPSPQGRTARSGAASRIALARPAHHDQERRNRLELRRVALGCGHRRHRHPAFTRSPDPGRRSRARHVAASCSGSHARDARRALRVTRRQAASARAGAGGCDDGDRSGRGHAHARRSGRRWLGGRQDAV